MTRQPPPGSRRGGNGERKARILLRDGYRCAYCGRVLPESDLTVDHVEPRMRGGDASEGNLVACCRVCNAEKGGAPAWRYLATRPEQRANFLRYAVAVWPRLRRAVEQAAERSTENDARPKL
jgi:5-methylcytosine-specific restriction endonuclease McrA